MSPSAIDDAHTPSKKIEKKHKRDKSEHKKKRSRYEDDSAAVETTPREYKRSKSEVPGDENASDNDIDAREATSPSKKKKSKKEKREKEAATDLATDDETRKERKKSKKSKKHQDEEQDGADMDAAEQSPKKESSSKREKHKDKKSKKDRKKQEAADEDLMDVDTAEVHSDDEAKEKKKRKKEKSKDKKKRIASPEPLDQSGEGSAMEVDFPDLSIRTKAKIPDIPADPSFPFFTQTTSIYVPFFPVGFDKPLTNVAAQHLDPLLNHYSPLLKGVLLKYSNLILSEKPVRASRKNPPTDQTPALLHSINEYAVGFGWLTFDAHLFKPSRGKWMEGVLQLQSEGHIGVVCWDKFNASIEAKRLPKGWKWIDEAKKDSANGSGSLPSPPAWDPEVAEDKLSESDNLDGEELEVVEQMHSTGYWVNEQGRKITGKLRFRIKNFDVGLAGDYGYLSIEGTFLDDEAERALQAEERENERRRRLRQNPNGLLRPMSKRVPEFSVTKFGKEEQEEDSGQRIVFDKGSRPGTPDN